MSAKRPAAFAAALLVTVALTACSGSGRAATDGATAAVGPASSSSTSSTAQPGDGETTPATVAPPLPQPVKSVGKVKRSGQPTSPSVSAPAARFTAPVQYPDGVRLQIVGTNRATETGHGPGVMAGRKYVRFQLKLTNGSSKPIDLNQVVLTTYYGSTKQLAAPVYTESAKTYDFGGTVKPGASATAYYAFAVPDSGLEDVTMVVDFDGVHTSATYSGAVVLS